MLQETRLRLEQLGSVDDPANIKKETSALFLDLQAKFEAGSLNKIQYVSEVRKHLEKIRNTQMPPEVRSYLNGICNEILDHIHS
jgi:hypothetical protein